MSSRDLSEYGSVDGIFDKEIKGKIDAPWGYARQRERCNVLMAGENLIAFESSVRALLGDLPLHIKTDVVARKTEFNAIPPSSYKYMNNCGVNIGTPDNPLVSVVDHPEWDFMNEVPEYFRDNHEDKITILSPIEIIGVEYTDHEKLFEIIKEEGERGGLGWKYDSARKETGPVEIILPAGLSRDIEKVIVKQLIEHRKKGKMYSWADMIGAMQPRTPRTPTPPRDEIQDEVPPTEDEVLEEEDQSEYRTPKGTLEQEIPYPSTYSQKQINELKRRGIKFINWNGTAMAVGPGMDVNFYNEIATNKKQRKSTIMALLGSPGKGKTWSGLRLCEIFDKRFDVKKQVVFDREHLLKIISGEIKIYPGQCVLIDEAHMATGARHWFEEIQRELVDQVATVRSMGIILIFVVLHISMLDNIIRQYVLTYQLHMEQRGVSVEYKVTMPRFDSKVYHPRQGRIALSVPGISECASPECLWCEHNDWCMNMRAIYERIKKGYLAEKSDETTRRSEEKRKKENPRTQRELMDIIYANKDLLQHTTRGTIDPSSIQQILEEQDIVIGQSAANILRNRLQAKYPELKKSKEDTTP